MGLLSAIANPVGANPQNFLTGLQGLQALKDFQARQALAGIYGQAINQTTGQLDVPTYNRLLSQDPRALWAAGPSMQQAGTAAIQQAGAGLDQLRLAGQRYNAIASFLTPEYQAAMRGEPVPGTALAAKANQAVQLGLVPPEVAAPVIAAANKIGNGDAGDLVQGISYMSTDAAQRLSQVQRNTDIVTVTYPDHTSQQMPYWQAQGELARGGRIVGPATGGGGAGGGRGGGPDPFPKSWTGREPMAPAGGTTPPAPGPKVQYGGVPPPPPGGTGAASAASNTGIGAVIGSPLVAPHPFGPQYGVAPPSSATPAPAAPAGGQPVGNLGLVRKPDGTLGTPGGGFGRPTIGAPEAPNAGMGGQSGAPGPMVPERGWGTAVGTYGDQAPAAAPVPAPAPTPAAPVPAPAPAGAPSAAFPHGRPGASGPPGYGVALEDSSKAYTADQVVNRTLGTRINPLETALSVLRANPNLQTVGHDELYQLQQLADAFHLPVGDMTNANAFQVLSKSLAAYAKNIPGANRSDLDLLATEASNPHIGQGRPAMMELLAKAVGLERLRAAPVDYFNSQYPDADTAQYNSGHYITRTSSWAAAQDPVAYAVDEMDPAAVTKYFKGLSGTANADYQDGTGAKGRFLRSRREALALYPWLKAPTTAAPAGGGG